MGAVKINEWDKFLHILTKRRITTGNSSIATIKIIKECCEKEDLERWHI
jgi:hypothetical protein